MVSRLPPPTCRPVQTRFRFGYAAKPLNLAGDGKSPDHYAKGTPSPLTSSPLKALMIADFRLQIETFVFKSAI